MSDFLLFLQDHEQLKSRDTFYSWVPCEASDVCLLNEYRKERRGHSGHGASYCKDLRFTESFSTFTQRKSRVFLFLFFFLNEQLYFFLQCSILDLSSLTRDQTCALWNGSMESQWAIVEVILCVLSRFNHVWLFAALWATAHRMAHRLLCP